MPTASLLHFGGQAARSAKARLPGLLRRQPGAADARAWSADKLPIALNPREGTRGRSLEVVTPNGDTWLVVATIVEDPDYLSTPFVTSTNFRKRREQSGWNPTACTAR